MKTLISEDVQKALERHFRGDWGECDAHDWQENDFALQHKGRLLSVFQDRAGTKFWIITDAEWGTTTVLLPDDY